MTSRDWSQLPQDMLGKLSTYLNTRLELLQFRSVCHSWRTSALPTTSLSHLLPLSRVSIIYAAQPQPQSSSSSTCWLIKVRETGPNVLHFMIPTSTKTYPEVLNTLNFKVTPLGKEYDFAADYGRSSPVLDIETMISENLESADIQKIICSSTANMEDCREGLSLVNPVVEHQKWRFDDVIYIKGRFYVVDMAGRTCIVDPHTSQLTLVANPVEDTKLYNGKQNKLFVKSNGELFLVDCGWYEGDESSSIEEFRDCHEQCKMYMLDEGNQQWIEVKSLGDCIFFVGSHCTFSISASDFLLPTGCKGNCVIFTDVESDTLGEDIEWSECKNVFDLEDGRFDTILNHPCYFQLLLPSRS